MKIAMIAGGNHSQSTSTALCRYIGRVLENKGHEAVLFDVYSKPLPMYTADRDDSEHVHVAELRRLLLKSDGVVLATPEYHGAPSGALKNALDFTGFDHFDGKVVLSVSSAGGAVGVSSLQQLQTIVRNVHGINCPEWISIGGDQRRMNEQGEPEDAKTRERVQRTVAYFVSMIEKFKA